MFAFVQQRNLPATVSLQDKDIEYVKWHNDFEIDDLTRND